MKDKNLDFLHEVAKKISDMSKQDMPITKEEVFDLFKQTLERVTTTKIRELPVFIPIIVEIEEDGLYVAKTYGYRTCKGIGRTEDEAIEMFREEIDFFNNSCINSDRKMKIEEIVRNLFPKDRF